jgi:NAD(P)-dependent dehydrogenase (short-subunit alcohol dehydrogenase family)
MSGWTAQDMPDQHGRVVVITGANSGVGYESAAALARKGARVVMACRSVNKAEQARQELVKRVPGATIDIVPLDLGTLKSIHAFTDAFNAQYDRLDILMNNAGIMTPPYGKTVDGFETQFGTNHLGHFALTGLLLPKLLSTPKSRVVTVSSSAYLNARINFDDLQSERDYGPIRAYRQSKLANILFALELQRKLQASNAGVISVANQPGYARTNLQPSSGRIIEDIFYSILTVMASHSAEAGATCQLYAATAPDVHGGEFFEPRRTLVGDVVRVEVIARGKDPETAARLWQVSEQLTGVRYDFQPKSVAIFA